MGVYKNNINNYSYVHDYSSYAYFLHLDESSVPPMAKKMHLDELDEFSVPPMAKKISKKHDNVNNVAFKVPCTVQVINITTNEWFRESFIRLLTLSGSLLFGTTIVHTAFNVLKVT